MLFSPSTRRDFFAISIILGYPFSVRRYAVYTPSSASLHVDFKYYVNWFLMYNPSCFLSTVCPLLFPPQKVPENEKWYRVTSFASYSPFEIDRSVSWIYLSHTYLSFKWTNNQSLEIFRRAIFKCYKTAKI